MLGVGMDGISDVEGRSQFSLWSILGAPLLLGTDVRNMSSYTFDTISNQEAIAINQDPLGVQGYQVDVTPPPTIFNGGTMLNLTACTGPGVPPAAGATWTLQADGHIVNANTTDCLANYDCGNSAGGIVFAYQCVTNQCGNELFAWDSTTGLISTNVTPAPSSPLCLTAVDPGSNPLSQLVLQECDASRADQKWTWGADGTLSITLANSSAPGPLCLTEYAETGMLYAKPLTGGDVAIAVLNRQDNATHPGYTVDLSLFSLAPSQGVMVRDIWANQTLGPFTGSFTTRPLASHETVLLRLSLAPATAASAPKNEL